MKLKRFLLTIFLVTASAQAAATDYTDIWFNPAEAGWGMNLVQSDTFMFLTFFLYGSDSKPTWFTGQVTLNTNSNNFDGTLYATTGTYYILPWAGFAGGPVGTVSFQPLGPYNAKLIYTVNGIGTVTKTIQRQPLTVITIGGEYTGGLNLAQAQCANSGKGTLIVNVSVSQPPNNIGPMSVTMAKSDGVTCNFSGPVTQWGKVYQIPNAAYTCTNGRSTTAKVDELTATAYGLEGTWTAVVEGGCTETGTFSAVQR